MKSLLTDKFVWLLGLLTLIFFYPVFMSGKIPIPADTIIGMYHPWRDKIWDNLAAGVPFKNSLITDPVREQYVWRKLAIDSLKKGELPVWNPYSFSGTPLLANFQSGAFYPFNLLYLILPFNIVWTIQIILQPLLASLFLYIYLRFLKVCRLASFLGGFSFAFSGFSIAWLEWNTILHSALWLPLILLSIDKLIFYFAGDENAKLHLKNKNIFFWSLIFIFSTVFSFFAGHLQIFFYSQFVVIFYLLARIMKSNQKKRFFILFFSFYLLTFILTSIQWYPTLQLILNSAREVDQSGYLQDSWFIPWQNLIQFMAPDFFGNPATGNYWGIWNYGEFVGFIGIIPFLLSIYALIFRHDRIVIFWGTLMFIALIFALPTSAAKILYLFKVPLISTSQPTRLLYVIDLTLGILAALGLDQLLKDRNIRNVIKIITPVGLILLSLWVFILNPFFQIIHNKVYLEIAKRNLILPTLFFFLSSFLLIFIIKAKNKFQIIGIIALIMVLVTELFRFGWKFTPFTKEEWIFPDTSIISYIKNNLGNNRLMSLDRRILPSNFSAFYHLQDVSGYDPLYLADYNRFVGAWEKNQPDISYSSFNRIITPSHYHHFLTNLLGVKYILSFDQIPRSDLKYVMNEGNTYLYQNPDYFPRAFFVESIESTGSSKEEMERLFELKEDLIKIAVSQEDIDISPKPIGVDENVQLEKYSDNKIEILTRAEEERLLVLTDIYYPSWSVRIDGQKTHLYKVDFLFRGVKIPKGEHQVVFEDNLI